MARATIGPKFQGEVKDTIFDFSGDISATDSIASVSTTVTVLSGVDATPSTLLSGLPAISGFGAVQRITGGVRGVKYLITVAATATGGTKHYQEVELFIR